MEGGELFSRIQERADSAFTERGKFAVVVNYMVGIDVGKNRDRTTVEYRSLT